MKIYVSGYRIMWILVMFDLPTVTREEQKRATEFRNSLLELGFQMMQYSVYIR
ncbi:MAG: CRISPR-associated endonuclease Cas2, partial [Desulfovibrionaceae bacterium]|nr:CRISPR-associated endonuclease Cas2 [Desulfovibrionaceae bacterium]